LRLAKIAFERGERFQYVRGLSLLLTLIYSPGKFADDQCIAVLGREKTCVCRLVNGSLKGKLGATQITAYFDHLEFDMLVPDFAG